MHHTTRSALVFAIAALAACGGNLGDLRGPAGPVGPPPVLPPAAVPQTGLVSMTGYDNAIRVDYVLPNAGFEAALYLRRGSIFVYEEPPVEEVLTGTTRIFTATSHPTIVQNGTSIADEPTVFAGFAIRPVGATAWTPVGSVVRAHPCAAPSDPALGTTGAGVTIYVAPSGFDPDLQGPNDPPIGFTPDRPVKFLDYALLLAATYGGDFLYRGANVLVQDGTYTTRTLGQGGFGAFPVGPDVHVYGGFKPGFLLEERDPLTHTTTNPGSVLLGGGGTTRIVDVNSGGRVHVVDGFVVDGQDVTTEGIDIIESDCELRSVRSIRTVDNGVRIKQLINFTNRRRVDVVACDISQNGSDGLGVNGVFQLVFDRSTFDANFGAGIDINDLICLEGNVSSVTAFGCRFFGNSLEGLAMDLVTLTTANLTPGGLYQIHIEGCNFERNGLVGLDIDEDHDLFPAWHDSVRIRDCTAHGNRTSGIHIDADDQGDYVLERVRCTANGGDGFLVTSEPDDLTTTEDDLAPGHLNVIGSYFGGNLSAGIRTSQGDKVVCASQCAFAGNQAGGIVAELSFLGLTNTRRIDSAVNCVFWQQPTPFTNTVETNCWLAGADNPFAVAPAEFAVATAHANGALTLATLPTTAAGGSVVIADDRVTRSVLAVSGNILEIDPPPTNFSAPESVFGYPTATTTDDLRLLIGSPAAGTGLAPLGTTVDPGPWGAISGGEPGVYDPFSAPTLHVLDIRPAVASGVAPTSPIVITFDQPLDAQAFTADFVEVAGASGFSTSLQGDVLTINPPAAGWSGTPLVQLHRGIAATDGRLLAAPLMFPLLPR